MKLILQSLKIIIITSFITSLLCGCSTTSSTPDLNIQHPKIIGMVYETEVLVMFCGDEAFHQRYSEQEPQPNAYFILNKNKRFLDFKVGFIYEYQQHNYSATLDHPDLNWQSKLSKECGIGKKYPYIYWFTIETTKGMPHDKDKQSEYLKNYEEFKQQILNNRSLTVSVSRPAFLIGENLIADSPSTLTFNEEQYQQLKTILEAQ